MASPTGWLARRFFGSKSSDGFVSLISWVSVLGVAVGVTALVVVTSVINGFRGELVRVITSMNGDVVLYSRAEPVRDPEKVIAKLREVVPELAAVTPSFVAELMIAGPNAVSGAILEGLDIEASETVTSVGDRVVQGTLPQAPNQIALGSALAEKIGAKVGDAVRLLVPSANVLRDGEEVPEESLGTPEVLERVVSGIIQMGFHDYDSRYIFGRLKDVQTHLGQPGAVTAFKIRLADPSLSREVSDRLSEAFAHPFRAKDWSQLNRNLFYAIELEKVVIFILLTVIVIVAAFNVVSTLMMMIHDKTKEIAILKAMGLRPNQGFWLFARVGLVIGLIGTVSGVGLGLGLSEVLRRTRLIELPADIYRIGFLPIVTEWREVVGIGLLSLLITFMATLWPALVVSRRAPMEGIRYE